MNGGEKGDDMQQGLELGSSLWALRQQHYLLYMEHPPYLLSHWAPPKFNFWALFTALPSG